MVFKSYLGRIFGCQLKAGEWGASHPTLPFKTAETFPPCAGGRILL